MDLSISANIVFYDDVKHFSFTKKFQMQFYDIFQSTFWK